MAESPTPSDATASDATASDAIASDATASDATASDATASDASASDAIASDATASDATASDVAASDVLATDPVNLENMVDITKLNAPKYPIVVASDAMASDATDPVNLENMVDITKLFPIVVTYTDGAEGVSDEYGNTYLFKDGLWVCDNNPDLVCSGFQRSIWEPNPEGWPEAWNFPDCACDADYNEYIEKHSNESAFRVDHVMSECFTTRQVLNSEVRRDKKYGTRTYVFRGKVYVNGGKENYFVVYMTLCNAAEDDWITLFSDIEYRGFVDDVVDGFNPYDMCVHKVQKNGYGDDDSVWKLGPCTSEF
jgi:hypothetical protein